MVVGEGDFLLKVTKIVSQDKDGVFGGGGIYMVKLSKVGSQGYMGGLIIGMFSFIKGIR